jgi:hypothetical protein
MAKAYVSVYTLRKFSLRKIEGYGHGQNPGSFVSLRFAKRKRQPIGRNSFAVKEAGEHFSAFLFFQGARR